MKCKNMVFFILLFYTALLFGGLRDVKAADDVTVRVGCIDIEGFLLVDGKVAGGELSKLEIYLL